MSSTVEKAPYVNSCYQCNSARATDANNLPSAAISINQMTSTAIPSMQTSVNQVMHTASLPAALPSMPTGSIYEKIQQLQREKELSLLQQQVAALRLAAQPVAPAPRTDFNAIEAMVVYWSRQL